MDNHEIDIMKAEKENAIANYRRLRNIAKLFHVLKVFIVFALISWSTTRLPSAVKLSGEYLIQFSAYLFNPHVVFVFGNVIVLALYVLSRHVDGTESDFPSCSGIVSEEYHKCNTVDHSTATASENELVPSQQVTEVARAEEKQIVCFEYAVGRTECEAAAAVAAAIETAKKQIKRFQRTQSEKLKREISMKPRKEYRRSETEIRRVDVTSLKHGRRTLTSFDTVDRLSNEQFRLTVETFIEKQLGFLKSQKLAEISR